MVPFCIRCGDLYSLDLLLLATACLLANGQQAVGVSLKFQGESLPNGSFVDIDDLLYTAPFSCCNEDPSNARPDLHDQTLLCETDLIDCCESPRTVRGDWYYPDGSVVPSDAGGITFRKNRGPNEIINGRQFYGSVRLFRKFSRPSGKGRFRCELPSAADPSVNQTLYAYVVDFGYNREINPVTIFSSGSGIAGDTYSLTCSATLFIPIPLPSNIPSPTFQWSFCPPNFNPNLPSGVSPMGTTSSSNSTSITYTSTLQFSPLSQSHTGNYTCRLGAGSLVNNATVTALSVQITRSTSGTPIVGQNGYSLTCGVIGAENLNPLFIHTTYQWTKKNRTHEQIIPKRSKILSFSSLKTSDAGRYTCQATISSSFFLHKDITIMDSQDIIVQLPKPKVAIRGLPRDSSLNFADMIRSPNFSAAVIWDPLAFELDPAVDTGVSVEASWERNPTQNGGSSDGRITVADTQVSGVRVTFNPIGGAGTYNLNVSIIQAPNSLYLPVATQTLELVVLSYPSCIWIPQVTDGSGIEDSSISNPSPTQTLWLMNATQFGTVVSTEIQDSALLLPNAAIYGIIGSIVTVLLIAFIFISVFLTVRSFRKHQAINNDGNPVNLNLADLPADGREVRVAININNDPDNVGIEQANLPVDGHERAADREEENHDNRHQDEGSVESLLIYQCPVHDNIPSAEVDHSASASYNHHCRLYDTIPPQPKSNQESVTKQSSKYAQNDQDDDKALGSDYEHTGPQTCELTQVASPLPPNQPK